MNEAIIRVSQIRGEEAEEVAIFVLKHPRINPWELIKREFPYGEEISDEEPNQCLIDYLIDNGDSLEDTIVVSAGDALWFLTEFLPEPEDGWEKIKV